MFYTSPPLRNNIDECIIVDKAYIETLTTVFDDITNGQVLVRLIQVIARPRPETLPRSRVFIKLDMNPENRFVIFGETTIIQEVLLDEFTITVLFFDVYCFLVLIINETNKHYNKVSDC